MMATRELASPACGGWLKLAALLMAVAVIGLPINHIEVYGLLLVAALVIFCGEVRASKLAWSAAIAIVAVCAAGQYLLAPPRIDEGHNVFLPGGPTQALEHQLPAEVYRQMAAEFDALYPPGMRCKPGSEGCWQTGGFPDAAYAFSADGIWHKSPYSRSVTELDFSDPVWLRLGFINELRYNWWSGKSDIDRVHRDRRFWMGLHRWHLAMPWYEVLRLPAAFVGGELCWRGEVMWEGAGEHFSRGTGDGCRAIEPADVGRRIFGIAIKPDTLAMQVLPPTSVRLKDIAAGLLAGLSVLAIVGVLVRFKPRQLLLPAILLVLALLVIAIDDASFIGGVRPFDGGDDGLFSEGAGRLIAQYLLAGDFTSALRGGEDVFWNLPGLRYLRALELFVFGDTNFGYLSLMLAMPLCAYGLFRRFLSEHWALAMVVIFLAIPVGAIFGSSYFQYINWAARGYSDPGGAAFLLAGLFVLVSPPTIGANIRFVRAFGAGFLLFLAVFLRPNLAPFAAVMLGVTGFLALIGAQLRRLAGLCLGFLPVVCMALHNWYFGRVFVLFGGNATESGNLPTPPTIYVSAFLELVRLDLFGKNIAHVLHQLAGWLSGPAESYWTIPLNAVGIVILVAVVVRGRAFDPWLRLVAVATLAEHSIALFYRPLGRYYYITWLLTAVVCAVWMRTKGLGLLWLWLPRLMAWLSRQQTLVLLARGIDWLAQRTGRSHEGKSTA
jgi:hypothetical protein